MLGQEKIYRKCGSNQFSDKPQLAFKPPGLILLRILCFQMGQRCQRKRVVGYFQHARPKF